MGKDVGVATGVVTLVCELDWVVRVDDIMSCAPVATGAHSSKNKYGGKGGSSLVGRRWSYRWWRRVEFQEVLCL